MRVSRADSAHVADATGQAISQILGSVPSQPTSPASTDRSSVPCYTLGKGWCALALLFHLLVPRAEVGDRCCEVLHSFSCHKLLLRFRVPLRRVCGQVGEWRRDHRRGICKLSKFKNSDVHSTASVTCRFATMPLLVCSDTLFVELCILLSQRQC